MDNDQGEAGQRALVEFSQGTLLLRGGDVAISMVAAYAVRDERVGAWRAKACHYAPIVLAWHRGNIPYDDRAKNFAPLGLRLVERHQPRSYQQAALAAWRRGGGRGVVVMPTGSGKSFLACLAIESVGRPTLVVVPTIDLMQQWASQLEAGFGMSIGMLGGGSRDTAPLTVSTYDSAVLRMEFIGNQFGMVVFDECHHLPGNVNRCAALMCAAPYRLGLTATPERDEGEELIYSLIGPLCYRVEIDELEGMALAPYDVVETRVELSEDERLAYEDNRRVYSNFLRSHAISFRAKSDWGRFLALCARMPDGRQVFNAYLAQRRIARGGAAKFAAVWRIIRRHRGERVLVFTADNDTAYRLGAAYLLPVITHQTAAAERKDFLDSFRRGDYPVLVTSKVLNEGVDVPEASVGVVVSGSGSVREHVQRLGRILRPRQGKRAVLYELISADTAETHVSERRRQHRAYQRPATLPPRR